MHETEFEHSGDDSGAGDDSHQSSASARRCCAGGRERERADCSANTYRLEVIYTALERYDQGRHNAHTKKWGADDYNSCAGVIACPPPALAPAGGVGEGVAIAAAADDDDDHTTG